jgi:hypothetical protein
MTVAGNQVFALVLVSRAVWFLFCCRYMGELNGRIGLFPANYTEDEEQRGDGHHHTQGDQMPVHEGPSSETHLQGKKCRQQRAEKTMHVTFHLTRWHRRPECSACAAPTGCKTACCRHRKCVVERSASRSLIDGSINATASALDDNVRDIDKAVTLRNCITEHSARVFSSTD